MSIQGQVVRVASALERQALPPEIAFLSRHGVEAGILRQAAEIATAVGVTADEAALKGDLLDEPTFYRALAAELGLPFLAEVEVDESARYPESIVAGLVPIARAFGAHRDAMAPKAEAVVRLLTSARGYGPGLAITTLSALRQGVLRGRQRSIAWHAANDLPETRPEWSFREGGSWAPA